MSSINKPLFDIDKMGMQLTVNSYLPGTGFAWQKLFPLKYVPTLDIKGLEGNEGIPVAADRVAFNTTAPRKTRRKVGSWEGKLGKIAVAKEKNETDIIEYRNLQTLAAASDDPATANYLVDMVYDDMDFCNKAMDARVEIDALRIGSSGFHTFNAEIDGDMATADAINFNIPEDNFHGAKVVWTDADKADGIADIIAAQKAIAKKGLNKPMFAILEQEAFDALLAQTKTIRRLFPHFDANSLSVASQSVTADDLNRYLSSHNLPQVIVIDSYATVEHKDGSHETVKPWNENVVTLSPTAQLGYTYYTNVPTLTETAALQVQGAFYKVSRYSEDDPMKEVTKAEAYLQPGLINRASLAFINVNATTWNSGDKA